MYKIIGADQQQYGPVTGDQIRQWLNEGRLNAQSMLQAEGTTEWRPLASFPEFATSIPIAAPTAPLTMPAPASKTNSMAMWGMIMGIISVLFCWCCYGVPFNILGIVFSSIGLVQIGKTQERGKSMAIAGLVLSIISVILALCFLAYVLSHPDLIQRWKTGRFDKF